MNVDLHTHTYPASACSEISLRDYIAWCAEHRVEALALTNHGDTSDNLRVAEALTEEGILLIHGVEISTLFGDFLIYSDDLEYLATFREVQGPPRAGQIAAHAAVVWAHPLGGGGMSGSAYYPGLEREVAGNIDAVEVFNGNWPDESFVHGAEAIAAQLGVPRTGGSDAHRLERIMYAYTEIPGTVESTSDVVRAIKEATTIPHRTEPSKRRRLGIF